MAETQTTVMVVDDTATTRMNLTYRLHQSGYKVMVANDGNEAVLKITEHKPDIVLMDLHLPDMTGIECIKKLKTTSSFQSIKFIMVSADSNYDRKMEAFDVGCIGYIDKDTVDTELIERVESAERLSKMMNRVQSTLSDTSRSLKN